MLPISHDEIAKWRIELQLAEKFRKDEFGDNGEYQQKGAGENINYFEQGLSARFLRSYQREEQFVSLNIVYPLVKNVIPTLYYKNPYLLSIPKRKIDESSAPYAGALLNHYYGELNIKSVNQKVIFDAYVLGVGICKLGYATQFGTDIPDEELKEKREKSRLQKFKELLGLKTKEKEEELPVNIELNEFIRAENPYVVWVNPFDFLIDPAAIDIYSANWVAQRIRKRLSEVKANKGYKNTDGLKGADIEAKYEKEIPPTQIEEFKTIDLWEIHYKKIDGFYILTLAAEGDYLALRHEKSIYEIEGFQYELLDFNKHGHKLYPVSDIDVIKGLQDRINITFENILDQLDSFMTKIGVDETSVTAQGKRALESGDLGAIVYFKGAPGDKVKEIGLTQVKGDLINVIDKFIDVMALETGLTRAMLTGLTSAQTATEAQIGQAGQNLRLSDKADMVADFANRQARKLWQIIRQFVDLEKVELIVGEQSIDEITGAPRYKWLPQITGNLSRQLTQGEYDFKIEVGSTQKPDLPILRKQIENIVNILAGKGVLATFAAQGYKIELAEILKDYLRLFPDVFINPSRIIKPLPPQQAQLIAQGQGQRQSSTGGNFGVMPQQFQEAAPNMADLISQAAGEKGQIVPPLV